MESKRMKAVQRESSAVYIKSNVKGENSRNSNIFLAQKILI